MKTRSRILLVAVVAALRLNAVMAESAAPTGAQNIAQPKTASPPLSPEESLKKLHVREGYRAEIVAAEPLLFDPVAFDWDERGRLWVVEMADYPLGMDGNGKPGGRVRILEDIDGDGRYDRSEIFADGLSFPTGILCWKGGCLITAAPEIFLLTDTTGSGKANNKKLLFTGFSTGNQQLRVNGLRWGMDGWVYCAAGGHSGNYNKNTKIACNLTGEEITLGSRDFRFHPDSGVLDPQSGPSQFGRCRDDWGHWFGVQNSRPLWQYVLQDHYVRRNPYVIPPDPVHLFYPLNPLIYPASSPEKRFHSLNESGRYTSACGVEIYRDALLFGATGIHGFTCEPFANVVQHHVMEDEGVTFNAKPDTDGKVQDFFASEDRWCRPVMARTGPDGALYIADMYRYIIEHPQWLPQNGKDELMNFYREGDNAGRLYRVFSKEHRPSQPQPLADLSNVQLVALLGSSNGWLRDKAQMMLIWRDAANVSAALIALVNEGAQPQTRSQAAWTLQGLGQLPAASLLTLLSDANARVREQALLIAELHAGKPETPEGKKILEAVLGLVNDPDAKVRLQLACSLGQFKDASAGAALAALIRANANEPYVLGAAMSSAPAHLSALASMEMTSSFQDIVSTALGMHDESATSALLQNLNQPSNIRSGNLVEHLTTVRDFLAALKRNNSSLDELAGTTTSAALRKNLQKSKAVFDEIATLAPKLAAKDKALLIEIALLDPAHQAAGMKQLHAVLDSTDSDDQKRAVGLIARYRMPEAVEWLLPKISSATPSLRLAMFDALMAADQSTQELLASVKSGVIPAGSLDAQQQARLLKHPNPKIKALAATLFTSAPTAHRAEVLEKFKPTLLLKGDAARGKVVFSQICVACHRLEGVGIDFGPDLRSVVEHPSDKLLNSILDPSAIIEPGFTAYHCTLKSGEALYGVVATETSSSITIKMAGNVTRSVLRNEIASLQSTGTSFMPDGLEGAFTVESLADLIAYLKQPKPGAQFKGN